MPKTLAQLEYDLRRAAEVRQFNNVQDLAMAYCHAAAEHLMALPPQDPERVRIVGKVKEVLDWALLMMLTARASCLDELNRLQVVNRYRRQPDIVHERVHFSL